MRHFLNQSIEDTGAARALKIYRASNCDDIEGFNRSMSSPKHQSYPAGMI